MSNCKSVAYGTLIGLVVLAFHVRLNKNRIDKLESILPSLVQPGADAAMVDRPARLYRVTAYCPCEKCCGKWADGYTASGRPAVGLIVAAPPNIPFGTVLNVPGYSSRAVVLDRGGAIAEGKLDILMTDKDGNTLNDNYDNLQCMPRARHINIHREELNNGKKK